MIFKLRGWVSCNYRNGRFNEISECGKCITHDAALLFSVYFFSFFGRGRKISSKIIIFVHN